MPDAIDARGVAAQLAHALLGGPTARVKGDRDRAEVLPRLNDKAIFTISRVAAAGAVAAAYRDKDPRSVWLLQIADWPRLRESLVATGACDIRFLSGEG